MQSCYFWFHLFVYLFGFWRYWQGELLFERFYFLDLHKDEKIWRNFTLMEFYSNFLSEENTDLFHIRIIFQQRSWFHSILKSVFQSTQMLNFKDFIMTWYEIIEPFEFTKIYLSENLHCSTVYLFLFLNYQKSFVIQQPFWEEIQI